MLLAFRWTAKSGEWFRWAAKSGECRGVEGVCAPTAVRARFLKEASSRGRERGKGGPFLWCGKRALLHVLPGALLFNGIREFKLTSANRSAGV